MPEQDLFRFLDLPAELRERIYSFLFISCSPITLYGSRGRSGYQISALESQSTSESNFHTLNSAPRLSVPAISMVNRLLRHECLHVFFGKNCFNLGDGLIQGWLYTLSDENVTKIRHIKLEHDISHFLSARALKRIKLLPDHTISCEISLLRREPWYTLRNFYGSDEYRDGCLDRLKERMNGVLCRTLQKTQEPRFNLIYLMKLYEFWLLWCYQLLRFGSLRVRPLFPEQKRQTLRRRFLLRLAEKERQRLAHQQRSENEQHICQLYMNYEHVDKCGNDVPRM